MYMYMYLYVNGLMRNWTYIGFVACSCVHIVRRWRSSAVAVFPQDILVLLHSQVIAANYYRRRRRDVMQQ